MSSELEQIKMRGEYLFVQPIEEPKEVGGLIIPDTAEAITQRGEVMAMGLGGDFNIKLNDIVVYKKKIAAAISWKHVVIDGKLLLVMKKMDVFGVMFGEDAVDVTPTKEWVFLEWEKAKAEYEGGKVVLIRPDAYREMYFTGKVAAIGPDVKELSIGDRVFFDQFCGLERFQEDGKRYAFVRQSDIYCSGLPERVLEAVTI